MLFEQWATSWLPKFCDRCGRQLEWGGWKPISYSRRTGEANEWRNSGNCSSENCRATERRHARWQGLIVSEF